MEYRWNIKAESISDLIIIQLPDFEFKALKQFTKTLKKTKRIKMPRIIIVALLVAVPAVLCAPTESDKKTGRSLPPPPALRPGVGTSTGVHLPGVDAVSGAGVGRYPGLPGGFPIPGVPGIPGIPGYPGVGTASNVNLPGVSAGGVAGVGYPGYPFPGVGVPYYPGVGTGSNVNLPGVSAGSEAGAFNPLVYG